MPLQQIAHHIITLADKRASTPVLVTPPYLSFRPQFFVELTREIAKHTDRSIRLDWYRGLPGVRSIVSDQVAAWQVKSVNRILRKTFFTRVHASIELGHGRVCESSIPVTNPASSISNGEVKPRLLVEQGAKVQITATIARPGGKSRDLIIGLSDVRQRLPDWTSAIWLGTSAEEVKRWQAA